MAKSVVTDKHLTTHQFRMFRLQVLNWGTFSDLHDIAISEKGFLFTGRSGSGKSTLLDAIGALLMRPGGVDFNAAARAGEKSKKGDRNILTYLRGAYGEQTDNESGEIAAQYLRKGATRSALALSFRNGAGKSVSLVQFLYIRGSSNAASDVQRMYMIFERDFDLEELSGFDLDIRKIKHAFNDDAHINDEFRPHSEKFRRLLGIENELALTLLHKTQSAKNLGELNEFLRSFMLEEPDTFVVAQRLVTEFGELDQAHKSVLTARLQIQTLAPAQITFSERAQYEGERARLLSERDALAPFTEKLRSNLLRRQLEEIELKIEQAKATREQKEAQLLQLRRELDTLEEKHRDMGGDAIARLEIEKTEVEAIKTAKLLKLSQAEQACKILEWEMPTNAKQFVELASKARQLLEEGNVRGDDWRKRQYELLEAVKLLEKDLQSCRTELESLRRQPSNIPSRMLQLRRKVASAINVHEDSLPFAGELIEVRAEESEWRGVIERVLRGLALSLLVPDKHYGALTNYVNESHLGGMLVYFRTSASEVREERPASLNSMFTKLKLKGNSHSGWLEAELKRMNYDCVASAQACRAAERPSITKEGLIKSSKTKHIKDDRNPINDRQHWVLGFDNKEKLSLFEREELALSEKLKLAQATYDEDVAREKKRSADALRWTTLSNLQWNEIDVSATVDRLQSLDKQLAQLRSKNVDLAKLSDQIRSSKNKVEAAVKLIADLGAEERGHLSSYKKFEDQLVECQSSLFPLVEALSAALSARFSDEPAVTLGNLDKVSNQIYKTFGEDMEALATFMSDCKQKIEIAFAEFKRLWPAESANMCSTMKSCDEYFALLSRLKNDNLPQYEDRFYELLRTQSNQNLAALNTHLSQARKSIIERMEMVNESLRGVLFGTETYLQILMSDRNLVEVKDFRQEVTGILSHAWSADVEQSEGRFEALRDLVRRLSSQENADRRWREAVLDVRQHVEFVGQEIDSTGREIETYRSGAGKSGGQRQKLTTTCLAAALHYQLSGKEGGAPSYAAVVLDEAFDKADHEFTAISMKIFEKFGFQMIIATPIKSVMTLESFIGGACYVDIRDRKFSSHLPIQYDIENNRLKLTEELRRDAESSTAVS